MNTNEKIELYQTVNLPLAAFLLTTGASLIRVDKTNPKCCIFFFNLANPDLITKWQTGEAQCNPLTFYNSLIQCRRELRGSVEVRNEQ